MVFLLSEGRACLAVVRTQLDGNLKDYLRNRERVLRSEQVVCVKLGLLYGGRPIPCSMLHCTALT